MKFLSIETRSRLFSFREAKAEEEPKKGKKEVLNYAEKNRDLRFIVRKGREVER